MTSDGVAKEKSACPRCTDGVLLVRRYGKVRFEHCCGCQGLLVGLRDLRRLLERVIRDFARAIDLDEEVPAVSDIGGVACRCGRAMDNFDYLGQRRVYLDRCEECEVVWVDSDELEAAAALCARSEARIRHVYEEARRDRKTYVDDHAEVMAEARARANSSMGGGAGGPAGTGADLANLLFTLLAN